MLRRRIFTLFLVFLFLLTLCMSTAMAKIDSITVAGLSSFPDANGNFSSTINLNSSDKDSRIFLNGINRGTVTVNGFKVKLDAEGDRFFITPRMLTYVANAMYIKERWPG